MLQDKHMEKRLIFIIIVMLAVLLCSNGKGVAKAEESPKVIKVAFVKDQAPYQFMVDGENRGMHIEIMDEVARVCNWYIRYYEFQSLSQCVQALREGSVDAILGVPTSSNLLRYEKIIYSSEISSSYICLASNKKIAQKMQTNHSLGVWAALEYRSLSYDSMRYYSNVINYIGVSSQRRVFEELISGRIDVAFADKTSLLYYLREADLTSEYPIVYNFIQPIQFSIVVSSKNEKLLEDLNAGIATVRSGWRYEQIVNKWIPVENDSDSFGRWLQRYKIPIATVLFLALALIVMNIYMNYLLKSQVKEKTKELQNANDQLSKSVIKSQLESNLRGQAIESNPNGILLFDTNGLIELSNQSANIILGCDLVGHNISELPILNCLLAGEKKAILNGGEPISEKVMEVTLENGTKIYKYSTSTFVRPGDDGTQKKQTIFMVIEDITLQKIQSEQILTIEKSRLLNQMVAGIAHEIRNPLAAIKAFAQSAKVNRGDEDYLSAFEEIVPKEVERINRLVGDLIDYSKEPQNGMNRTPVNVRDMVNSCLNLVQVLVKKDRIDIQVDIAENLIFLADEGQIWQVILNILLNSVEAIRQKQHTMGGAEYPHVTVRAWRGDGNTIIEISDTGIGMSPRVLKHATQPFFTTKKSGTGIGLAISNRYIVENGGLFSIMSEEGKYTKVRITFPDNIEFDQNRGGI
jgi:polar amino acid transport system substrate-binding protein